MRCDRCGNILSGSRERGADQYRCANPHKKIGVLKPCRGCSIRADEAHAVIRTATEAWFAEHPDALAARAAQPNTDSREAELIAARDQALDEYGDLTAKRRFMKPERFASLRADLEAEIERYSVELGELGDVAQSDLPADLDWDGMSDAQRREAVELAIVTPIRVKPGRGGNGAPSALDRMLVEPRP